MRCRQLLSFPSRQFGPIGALLFAGLLIGCGKASNSKEVPPAEVIVATPISDQVTDFADFTGRLDATRTVEVRARVTGYLNEVTFKEGDSVKEGDVLFQIDPRTYIADFNQAVANVRLAEAEQKVQEHNAKRAKELLASNAISQEEYDTTVANWEKAKASVNAMVAAQDRVKQYLDFTKVISSCNGRISRRYADPGNLIKADDTLLTTIVTEDPIYAYFDVDERTYLDLSGVTFRETQSWLNGRQHQVLMRLANEDEFTHPGTADFIDNRLNGNSGTIRMRGIFENPNRVLKSGLFARIRLPIAQPYWAILIPDEAVLSDQGRKYVYVVNDKSQVEYRSVTLGLSLQGWRVIKQGIAKDDHVIIGGMQRVRPNADVHATVQNSPKPPGSPLTKMLLKGKSTPRDDDEAMKASDKVSKQGPGTAANQN
jgi:RND family efflux transporter MFP subunit